MSRDSSRVIRARVPGPLFAEVEAAAAAAGQTVSAALREILVAGLTGRGRWPPQPQEGGGRGR